MFGVQVRTVQRCNRWASQKAESALHIRTQYFERAGHAGRARGGEAISIGTADQNCAGAEADGFDHIGTAANASVHENLDLISDYLHHFRQNIERCGNAVELPSTVVRDHDGGCTVINRSPGIVAGENTLYDDRPVPNLADPTE